MTRPSTSVLRDALGLINLRLVTRQIGLALLVFALSIVWLRMPDASGLEVAGSVVLALVILAVAGMGESAFILHLRGRALTPGRLLRGAALLLAGVLLWLAFGALLDRIPGDDSLRAGYLNSRLPHSMRYFLTYARIALWLGWIWTALDWIGAGILALIAVCATASARPSRAIARALRSATYWIAMIVGVTAATVITGSLIQWTPGHGLRIEMLSLLLRLGAAILIDAAIACLLLAVLAAIIQRSDAPYPTPAGTPDPSQPRTAGNP
jgi:hypothetical protein